MMRKANKEIRDREVIEALLAACPVGRIATSGPDGWPMVKPVNFVYRNGRIHFHTAKEGEKIDHIRRDNRVCFEADQPIAYVRGSRGNPCTAEYLYRSVIVKGRATIVEDEGERLEALSALMAKYQPEGGYGAFLPGKLAVTGIVRIDIETMTGKQDLGKEQHQEAVQETLSKGTGRSIVLDP
jgi:nitroimidazol reductase NimA-like FMN-containing flavoprotein (pyridoxamine 5'-phosphate oxidase superfamily)